MKLKNLLFTSIFMLVFSVGVSYGQWSTYTCDVTPELADPVWSKASTTDGKTDVTNFPNAVLCSVIDDPDIADNKLIQIEELVGDNRESWALDLGGGFSDATIGATAVFRTKPTAAAIAWGLADEDHLFFYFSMRNGAFQEEMKWYTGEVLADRMALTAALPGEDWHIFRITMINDAVNVYLDEDPFPFISGTTTQTTGNSMLRFGDNNTGPMSGQIYDWIAWDTTGAYAPGEGTPLPSELTGLPGGGTSTADLSASGNLSAYPNPFNGTTTIAYQVENTSMIRMDVYDVTGKLARNLVNEVKVAGSHEIQFNSEGMPAGMYYCQVRAGNSVSVVKLLAR